MHGGIRTGPRHLRLAAAGFRIMSPLFARRFGDVSDMSAIPPRTTKQRKPRDVCDVPLTEVRQIIRSGVFDLHVAEPICRAINRR
jgi:hypothetical protein